MLYKQYSELSVMLWLLWVASNRDKTFHLITQIKVIEHNWSLYVERKKTRVPSSVVLCCVVLCCVVLCCVVLRCVALRCVALRCVALQCVALCCVVVPLSPTYRSIPGGYLFVFLVYWGMLPKVGWER